MKLLDEEIFILPYEKLPSKKFFYAPKKGFVQLIELQDASIIEKGIISSSKDLRKYRNIDKLMEELQVKPIKDLDVMKKGIPILNIDFSNGCNMKCIYCYANRGEGNVKYQKKENIKEIVSIYFSNLIEKLEFNGERICSIVFGNDAEPTYSPDLIMYSVKIIKKKAQEYNIKPIFSMPTNGAFGSSMRNFIIDNFNSVSFSFEGLKMIQNKHRPFIDGSPSYDCVYKNAKVLYKSGMKIGFNIVVTTINLEYLKETVDYFHEHFKGTSISFSPVNLTGRALKDHSDLILDYSLFENKLLEAIAYAKKTSIKIRDKNIQNYHIPRRHYCSSTAKPNWNVSLNGEIFACMESKVETMKIGEIDFKTRKLKLEAKNVKCLQDYTVDEMVKCKECFAKYLCAGGCKVRNDMKENNCDHIRHRCLYLISNAYEEEQWIKRGQALFKNLI